MGSVIASFRVLPSDPEADLNVLKEAIKKAMPEDCNEECTCHLFTYIRYTTPISVKSQFATGNDEAFFIWNLNSFSKRFERWQEVYQRRSVFSRIFQFRLPSFL